MAKTNSELSRLSILVLTLLLEGPRYLLNQTAEYNLDRFNKNCNNTMYASMGEYPS